MSRPRNIRQSLFFGVKGLGKPALVVQPLSFSVNSPTPTIYVYDRGDWQPSAQRAWTTADEWFPSTV